MSRDRYDYAAECERAWDDHDPGREPYASMTRDEIFALMEAEGLGAYEYERLHHHFLDKCSSAELERINFTDKLSYWLIEERGAFGNQQAMHCRNVAIEAAAYLFEQMPPPGPLHMIN